MFGKYKTRLQVSWVTLDFRKQTYKYSVFLWTNLSHTKTAKWSSVMAKMDSQIMSHTLIWYKYQSSSTDQPNNVLSFSQSFNVQLNQIHSTNSLLSLERKTESDIWHPKTAFWISTLLWDTSILMVTIQGSRKEAGNEKSQARAQWNFTFRHC